MESYNGLKLLDCIIWKQQRYTMVLQVYSSFIRGPKMESISPYLPDLCLLVLCLGHYRIFMFIFEKKI